MASLNPAELNELLVEMGRITMNRGFCNKQYPFYRRDLVDVLGGQRRLKRYTDDKLDRIPLLYARYIFHNAAILT